jgi:hypothetical protein
MRRWCLLGLCLLGGCGAAFAASGKRTAKDAARAAWFIEQGPSTSSCEPSVQALTSSGFEVRCAEATRYVRCEYSSEEPCCWMVESREQATKVVGATGQSIKVCD